MKRYSFSVFIMFPLVGNIKEETFLVSVQFDLDKKLSFCCFNEWSLIISGSTKLRNTLQAILTVKEILCQGNFLCRTN